MTVRRRRYYRNHPEVSFKPGPFYMGDGLLGWSANVICILWTLFVCVIFALPNYLPVDATNMNYASVITAAVIIIAMSVGFCPVCEVDADSAVSSGRGMPSVGGDITRALRSTSTRIRCSGRKTRRSGATREQHACMSMDGECFACFLDIGMII